MSHQKSTIDPLLKAARRLQRALTKIDFSGVADWVYDPLDYAWDAYCEYITRFAKSPVERVFMGMNPGPWGMVQTGVPFGEVAAVRDWLKIQASAKRPAAEHPKRPIEGLACKRSEVSGERLWGLFQSRFIQPEFFFAEHFVINYCPLAFMDERGRNLTPDKFPTSVRQKLEEACDQHLISMLETLRPSCFIAVGGFAEECGKRCIERLDRKDSPQILRILHPSPASPAANRDWVGQVTRTLVEARVWEEIKTS